MGRQSDDEFDVDARLSPSNSPGETERNVATRRTWCECVTLFYCEAQRWVETRRTWCECATAFYCDAHFQEYVNENAPERAKLGPGGFGRE
jgi:hypothetical protein